MNHSEIKACEACKSSKRKCTKQLPTCRRCELRGLNCLYESRPRMVLYRADDDGGTLSRVQQPQYEQDTLQYPPFNASSVVQSITIDPQLELQLPLLHSPLNPSLDDLRSAWFLTPNAWKNTPIDASNLSPISTSMIHSHLDRTKEWLKEWASTGSNPFIHSQLYSKSMPSCMQDSFMALSAYLSKTDKTADMVHRLVEGKANKLVASPSSKSCRGQDTIEDIGRVQSLLIYCVIRLLDGDIRQRHFAEQHLPVLHEWTKDMLQNASCATNNDTLLFCNALSNYSLNFTTDPAIPCRVSSEQLLWHAWILSESVRRTWCISMCVQSGYELLKTGTGPCYGGLLMTTRKGVWDAETASTWTKMCAERNVGFLHRNDTERLMAETRIDDVDEFALAMMEIDVGPERMERWQRSSETWDVLPPQVF